jgi:hypothetical protein
MTSFLLELLVYPAVYQIWRWDFGLKRHLGPSAACDAGTMVGPDLQGG